MKKGLGRGLSALLDYDADTTQEQTDQKYDATDNPTPVPGTGGVVEIDIRRIEPNQRQPRQYFDEEALRELAESIRTYGVIQPLIVKDCGGHYAIIAGERRFRAARMAKINTIPAIVKDYSEMETLQIALIENIQRQDLTPIEEAACYKRLVEDFFFTQEDIAEKIGKNKHAVTNTLRLLELDDRAQRLAAEGKISASHARVLLTIKDGDLQFECAKRAVEEDLSVRALEEVVATVLSSLDKPEKKPEKEAPADDVAKAYRRAEDELKNLLNAKVNIRYGKKKGKIEIEYYSPDELDRLLCLFKERLTTGQGTENYL